MLDLAAQAKNVVDREEQVLVLYGSQRGSAEAAAERIAGKMSFQIASRLPSDVNTNNTSRSSITPKLMALDDWLEASASVPLTRLVVIVSSSFGVGGAPRNGKRFRRHCENMLRQQLYTKEKQMEHDDAPSLHMLGNIHFCLLGLGDSSYKTYMSNPQRIHDAWTAAGATLIGSMGKADGNESIERQQSAIDEWMNSIWGPMASVLREAAAVTRDQLVEATKDFVGDDL
ncbi:hypothetical protein MPSEU_000117800 [Mayamaea pseudoterrestris]|nr:hypothetical protein MPSEU_000117800 [Mayamaea pseudoterrestris]